MKKHTGRYYLAMIIVSVSLLQFAVRSTDCYIVAMIMVPVSLLQFSARSTELVLCCYSDSCQLQKNDTYLKLCTRLLMIRYLVLPVGLIFFISYL